MRPALVALAVIFFCSAGVAVRTQAPGPAGARIPAPAPLQPAAVLERYCVTCHNDRAKAGGLVIDAAGLADVSAAADQWEKVVRKLRGKSMPPVNMPRPDEPTHAALITFLESALDRAAAARPQAGRLPLAHRLSRTEYSNAVRDLLALEALPREASVDYLLPADNISSGFDNIADLLFVSPSNMERYLDVARKISRLAVGDPAMPVMVNIHRIDPEHPQDERVDTLPFGTRGGLAVRSEFPVDGTYVVKVELAGAPREPQQLEITIDGERVRLQSLGQGARGQGAREQAGRGTGNRDRRRCLRACGRGRVCPAGARLLRAGPGRRRARTDVSG